MKQVGKIYTCVDADELEPGDIVVLSSTLSVVKGATVPFVLEHIRSEEHHHRFQTREDGCSITFLFAKLLCPKKHAQLYWAWKEDHSKIEVKNGPDDWYEVDNPEWSEDAEYRIKSNDELKPLKKAFEEGKTIQAHTKQGWIDLSNPLWIGKPYEYRIKPEPEKRLMTQRELAKWCAQGNGQVRIGSTIVATISYCDGSFADDTLVENAYIRGWDEDEWHLPLVEV